MPRYRLPTPEQIKAELVALEKCKATVPKSGMMGNNHDGLDASASVLRDRMSHNDIYDTWGPDAGDESDFDRAVFDGALDAYNWMTGDDDESPSEKWA